MLAKILLCEKKTKMLVLSCCYVPAYISRFEFFAAFQLMYWIGVLQLIAKLNIFC